MTIRTRFAPSPTGYLHIGGARTALYCWLYAKKNKGTFILRIEDTDAERSTQESVQVIIDGMKWLDLAADEGPIYQTDRLDRYRAVAEQLVASGHAYPCYCSKERLESLRAEQTEKKLKPRYDGHCLGLKEHPKGQAHVIRFKNPTEGLVVVEDLIHGEVKFKNSELDDLVIIRTDKMPTYNFSVVVDDIDMKITHVIRGDDHLTNTPRQINIYAALGAALPAFAHVPMILGDDGKRLSKRHGAVSVLQYRDEGFLPQALLNYLVRLGWSHGDQEIFSREELVELFDITDVNKASSIFNTEKLLWLNQHYMKTLPATEVATGLAWQMQLLGIDVKQGPALTEIVAIQAERSKTLSEMAEKSRYFYEEVTGYDEKEALKILRPEILPILEQIYKEMAALKTWEKELIHQVILDTAEESGLKLGKVAQPIRLALTGGSVSPPLDITLQLLGQKRSIERLGRAIDFIKKIA